MICSRRFLTVSLLLTVAAIISPSVQHECASHLNNGPSSNCDVESRNMNTYVDDVVKDVATKIQEIADSKLEIPHINGKVYIDAAFLPINCTLQADNGYFADMSTLKRKGDAYLTKTGSKYTLTLSFTIEKAELHYNNYSFTCFRTAMTGNIVTEIKGFTLSTRLSVDIKGNKCVAEVNYIRIPQFEDVKVNISGLGVFDRAISQFISAISKKWHAEAIKVLEQSMENITNSILRDTCKNNRQDIVDVARELDPEAKID